MIVEVSLSFGSVGDHPTCPGVKSVTVDYLSYLATKPRGYPLALQIRHPLDSPSIPSIRYGTIIPPNGQESSIVMISIIHSLSRLTYCVASTKVLLFLTPTVSQTLRRN